MNLNLRQNDFFRKVRNFGRMRCAGDLRKWRLSYAHVRHSNTERKHHRVHGSECAGEFCARYDKGARTLQPEQMPGRQRNLHSEHVLRSKCVDARSGGSNVDTDAGFATGFAARSNATTTERGSTPRREWTPTTVGCYGDAERHPCANSTAAGLARLS